MTGSRFPVFLLRLFLTRPHRPGIKAAEDGLYIVVGLPQAALYRGDTSSPMGRAMMYIASVFSQLERKTIAERIRDNMHELAKTGRSFTRFFISFHATTHLRQNGFFGAERAVPFFCFRGCHVRVVV